MNSFRDLVKRRWLFMVLLTGLFVGGCTFPGTSAPTLTPTINTTQAYQTVIAKVTRAAALTASPQEATQTSVPTESGIATPGVATATLEQPTAQSSPTAIPCDRAAAGTPIDVTIPDDTEMAPGQTFTKIWRLENVGTCTWTSEYALVWFSGEKLGAEEVIQLGGNIAPGQMMDIAVDMVAPETPGTFQSNWKLRNASGGLFSIGPGGNSPFWVRIVVVEPTGTPEIATATSTPTATPMPTATLSPTPSSTPEVFVNGPAALAPGDLLDLDTNLVSNPNGGNDLLYSEGEGSNHLITPQPGALLGVFGNNPPVLQNCQSASLSTAPLAVESLPIGTYLCYQTDAGRYGWLVIQNFDSGSFALDLNLLTWAGP